LGSLVCTDKMNFYFAIAKGKVSIDEKDYYIVSLSSPIGKQFAKAKENDTILFNSNSYFIKEII